MPVFVATHNVADGSFSFVTDGVVSAVAQAAAVVGDGIVGLGAADIVQQCPNASLLDEIVINLAVLLGEGIRTAARGQPLRGDTDRSSLLGLRASGPSEVWRCKLELWPRQHVSCLPAIFTVTAPRP